MTYCPPTMEKRLSELLKALVWASGCRMFWKQQAGDRKREAQTTHGTIALRNIKEAGPAEKRYVDSDNTDYPLQEILVTQSILNFQVEFHSRSQEHLNSAWFAAHRCKTRLQSSFVNDKWLNPNELAIANLGDIVDHSGKNIHDNRVEDLALFEMPLNTALVEADSAMLVNVIESVELTSKFKDPAGNALADSLQWNKEVINGT